MLNNLLNAVKKYGENEKRYSEYYILNGFCEDWSEENKQFSDDGLKRYLTELRYNQYKKGLIDEEQARKYAISRMTKQKDNYTYNKLSEIERAENYGRLESLTITVEWKKSSTWGYNPHAEIRARSENEFERYEGTASGCGYDKETAAVAQALNDSGIVMKMLYTKEEERLQQKPEISRRDFIGYGSGYGVLPYFEGGVGMSSFQRIFENCGYKFQTVSSGKSFDVYTIEKVVK